MDDRKRSIFSSVILHLPGTVSTLEIRNQPNLSDFSIAGNGNLQALSIYGEHTFDSKAIVTGATNLVSVHLENVDWTGSNALSNTDLLLAIAGIVLDDNNVLSARDKEIIMIVVGFECYELDGTNEQTDPDERYARVVFQMQGTLNALVPMAGGPTPDGWGVLGWGDSDASNSPTIRTRLNFGYTSGTTDIPSIYSLLPVHWRNMIKPVKIKYLVGMGYLDISPSLKTCVDKLFLPSFVELGGIGSLTAQQQTHFVKEVGSRYGITDTEQHILQYYLPISGNGSAKLSKGPNNANADPYYADVPKSEWWTRSPVYTGQTVFQCIGSGGGIRYGYSTWGAKSASARISFAFCI